MSVKTCKEIGHDFELVEVFDNFDEVEVVLRCKRCNAKVSAFGSVRGQDDRFIEYHLEDEENEKD